MPGTPGAKEAIQEHSGELMIKIVPQSPTSADSLQAVFSSEKGVTWRWEKNGNIIEGETGSTLPNTRFARGDIISAIALSGGKGGKVSVTISNSPPEIIQVGLTPEHIFAGVEITAAPVAVDAEKDEVRFSAKWFVNGDEVFDDSLSLKGDRFKRGDRISVAVTPSDNYGAGKTFKTQTFVVPNGLPNFISTPPLNFQADSYSYNAISRDPDGDAVTYSLASSPKGMTIDSGTGRITWSLDPETAGSHTVKIIVRDSEGAEAFQEYNLNISLPDGAK